MADVEGAPKGRWPMKSGSRPIVAVALLVSLSAAACSSPVAGFKLPIHRDLDSYPAALLEATLTRDGECLYAVGRDGTERWLPIWPSGFFLDGEVVMKGTERIAAIGDRVRLGGGEYPANDYAFVRTLMTADLSKACRDGRYWLVGEIVP
jgi:hypothetical protein